MVTLINLNFRYKSIMIALLIVTDYYRERLKSFGNGSSLVSLSHLVMIAAERLKGASSNIIKI